MSTECGPDSDNGVVSPQQDQPMSPVGHSVKVAVNIRPLVAAERIAACQECISVVPGEPQVQVPPDKAYTFDHVYGSSGAPLHNLFDDCVLPLVDGLFQGYNATVLAYGQTGSGKTYTMGTAYTVGGSTEGVTPRVMQTIFEKVASLKERADFQLRVSFIEIHKEEIRDLLDVANHPFPLTNLCANQNQYGNLGNKQHPGRAPISIRETGNGGITLSGVTENDVVSLSEMAACLENGSLCRATGSTNMNAQSSRSHAIFTITVEQRRKWECEAGLSAIEDSPEDFLCAKLHLVDLAGSERVKKTKADGVRLQEGIHINKGLLALGNVISALGDDRKRKEGAHIPYRDSKLTRLLQDSLGGNSRTVMIACLSPADINMDESINTLKYANRARNIQNKPTVNRDPNAAEVSRLRQQLQLLQAELLCSQATSSTPIDKERYRRLEAENKHLSKTVRNQAQKALQIQTEQDHMAKLLESAHSWRNLPPEQEAKEVEAVQGHLKQIAHLLEGIHGGSHAAIKSLNAQAFPVEKLPLNLEGYNLPPTAGLDMYTEEHDGEGDDEGEGDNEALAEAKEWEYTVRQDRLDKELQALNKKLEEKEEQMRNVSKDERGLSLRQAFEKKLQEADEEKSMLQMERDKLLAELEHLMANSDEQAQKLRDAHRTRIQFLEKQLEELKRKQEGAAMALKQKQRSDERAKSLQEEILRMKQQKVQLQKKMRAEAEQFQAWKAAREKELHQLRREGRRAEYEMHRLQALNQRQKLVLQRKSEEAAAASKRLKEVLAARRIIREPTLPGPGGSSARNEEHLKGWLEGELAIVVGMHDVRRAIKSEAERRAALSRELDELEQEDAASRAHAGSPASPAPLSPRSMPLMSPRGVRAKLASARAGITASSQAILEMQQQLAEAEERERSSDARMKWQRVVRTVNDGRLLAQLAFSDLVSSRCELLEKEVRIKKEQERSLALSSALRSSEQCVQRFRLEKRLQSKASPYSPQPVKGGGTPHNAKEEMRTPPPSKVPSGGNQLMTTPPRALHLQALDVGSDADLRRTVLNASSRMQKPSGEPEKEARPDLEDQENREDPDYVPSAKKKRHSRSHGRLHRQSSKHAVLYALEGQPLSGGPPVSQGQGGHPGGQPAATASRPRNGAGGFFVDSYGTDSSHSGSSPNCSPPAPAHAPASAPPLPPPSGCVCTGKCSRKCGCRDNGGLCGLHCKCRASKCCNREGGGARQQEGGVSDQVAEDVRTADPVAEATAATLDLTAAAEAIGILPAGHHDKAGASGSSKGVRAGGERDGAAEHSKVRAAQQVLAIHGAQLEEALENGLRPSAPRSRDADGRPGGQVSTPGGAGSGRAGSVARVPLQDIDKNKVALPPKSGKDAALRQRRQLLTSAVNTLSGRHVAHTPASSRLASTTYADSVSEDSSPTALRTPPSQSAAATGVSLGAQAHISTPSLAGGAIRVPLNVPRSDTSIEHTSSAPPPSLGRHHQ